MKELIALTSPDGTTRYYDDQQNEYSVTHIHLRAEVPQVLAIVYENALWQQGKSLYQLAAKDVVSS
jgi:hypothetical protein